MRDAHQPSNAQMAATSPAPALPQSRLAAAEGREERAKLVAATDGSTKRRKRREERRREEMRRDLATVSTFWNEDARRRPGMRERGEEGGTEGGEGGRLGQGWMCRRQGQREEVCKITRVKDPGIITAGYHPSHPGNL